MAISATRATGWSFGWKRSSLRSTPPIRVARSDSSQASIVSLYQNDCCTRINFEMCETAWATVFLDNNSMKLQTQKRIH
eukprot:3829844-Amphidinium_carterae.1